MFIPPVNSAAPPMPAMARPAIRTLEVGAVAQIMEPISKRMMADT